MNDDGEMECVLDEELLSHMKCSDDELMEEQSTERRDMQIKSPVAEAYTDPLQDTTFVSPNFEWLFKDEDMLLQHKHLSEVALKPAKSRGKRGRPSNTNGSYVSANGLTWTLESEAQPEAQEDQLVKHQACGKGPTRSISNAVEAWMLLFDDDMLRMLQRIVNEQIRKRRTAKSTERPTDLPELRSWLGLNYLCGVFRNAQHCGPLEELWTLELGNAIFRATMSLARFVLITDCFSALTDCTDGVDAQRLWQKLLINCRSYYGPSSWLCVDELPAMDTRTISVCCDAKTLYMTNALLNKQPMAYDKQLMQLICDYKTTGRNVTLGSRFASPKHCEQLLECSLSSIGSLPSSSADYPKHWSAGTLVSGSKRLTHEAHVALLTCGWSRQLCASQAQLHTFNTCTRFHELSARYSTGYSLSKRSTAEQLDTFLQLLHLMLNIAAFNAWVLLRLAPKGDASIEQRDFQRQLGLFLTQQRLQRRLQRSSTTTTATTLVMRLQICEILGQSNQRLLSEAASEARQTEGIGGLSLTRALLPEDVTLVSRYGEKHRRCKPCARNKRETKARSRCQQCQAHRCGNHLISRCFECTGVRTTQMPAADTTKNTAELALE